MDSLIKRLSEAAGPPGYETQVRALIREEIAPFIDDLQVDNLGSLIATRGSRSEAGVKMMFAAHMDEAGLMVSHIDAQGFLRFVPLGALSQQTAQGSRIRFLGGQWGLIGAEKTADPDRYPTFDQLFIDSGAASRQDCTLRVGDVAVLDHPFMEFPDRWIGKALGSRVGVWLLVETLRSLFENKVRSPHELNFVFSAQKEVGSRGAATAAYKIEPDLAVEVDHCTSGDTPRGVKTEIAAGKGPAIKVRDQALVCDPRIVRWMLNTSEAAGIPHQKEISERNFLEVNPLQLARGGVPTGGLSIPARYLHTGSEMVRLQDVKHALGLLVELVHNPLDLGT